MKEAIRQLSEPGVTAPGAVIPLCIPEVRGKEWEYIKECLDSNWVSSVGPFVDRFEREIADYLGARFAIATTSGTSALHVSLLASGVEQDDEVLVSTLSFIAPANAIRYVGAWPVFIDAESTTWQMDVHQAVEFLEQKCHCKDGVLVNATTGRRVRALLPVHILGHPVDMDPLLEMARHYKLIVIEDAAESLGARYKGIPVGHLGDIACLSFNGNKIITTGGGGMVVTDDENICRRVRYLTTQAKDDPTEYIHREVGFNYRLSNIQAALGCAQLERLDEYVAAKRQIAEAYRRALAGIPGITFMAEATWASSTVWLYTILVDRDSFGMGSRDLLEQLVISGIQTRPLWQPLHQSEAHRNSQSWGGEVAEMLNRDALSLPSSVALSMDFVSKIADTIRGCCRTFRVPSSIGQSARS
jgi:perosamine synthetase